MRQVAVMCLRGLARWAGWNARRHQRHLFWWNEVEDWAATAEVQVER